MSDEEPVDQKKYFEDLCKPKCVRAWLEYQFFPCNGQVGYRDRGVRSLSRTEWEERRKKGLCYKCGQLYGPSHKCPEGKLHVLLLGDDESHGLKRLHFQLEIWILHIWMGNFSTKP